MGDWYDLYNALGYDMSYIPPSPKRRTGKVTVSVKLTKAEQAKYKELGGAMWIKRQLREAIESAAGSNNGESK